MKFYTIGVYNSSEEVFFQKLIENKIDLFCDIRRRRGVRGKKYAFVNSLRLQRKLMDLFIDYKHIIELAPTSEVREIQRNHDNKLKQLKRQRVSLGAEFIRAYQEDILNEFDFIGFLKELKTSHKENVAFFCVEEDPKSCHRSIVTEKLEKIGYKVIHL